MKRPLEFDWNLFSENCEGPSFQKRTKKWKVYCVLEKHLFSCDILQNIRKELVSAKKV